MSRERSEDLTREDNRISDRCGRILALLEPTCAENFAALFSFTPFVVHIQLHLRFDMKLIEMTLF